MKYRKTITIGAIGIFGSVIYFNSTPIKKVTSSKPLVGDVQVKLFTNTNSTIIGDVGNIKGDFNVNNH